MTKTFFSVDKKKGALTDVLFVNLEIQIIL